MTEEIEVEVAFASIERQQIIAVRLPAGSTVQDAIMRSGILSEFPEIQLNVSRVGILGTLATLDQPLRHRDRVEIYRPLIADPKEVRRRRAAHAKALKPRSAS